MSLYCKTVNRNTRCECRQTPFAHKGPHDIKEWLVREKFQVKFDKIIQKHKVKINSYSVLQFYLF